MDLLTLTGLLLLCETSNNFVVADCLAIATKGYDAQLWSLIVVVECTHIKSKTVE
jgi:hypothetical protein